MKLNRTLKVTFISYMIFLLGSSFLYFSQSKDNLPASLVHNARVRNNELSFSPNEVSLAFHDIYEISDDNLRESRGDSDGEVDAGETIELRIQLENNGGETATDVSGTISTADTNVILLNNTQDFVAIVNNSLGTSSSYYVFQVISSCEINHVITFSLDIDAAEGSWTDAFNLTVVGISEPVYDGYEIDGEFDGDLLADHDYVVDPGEEAIFSVDIRNYGGAQLLDLEGTITEADPFVTIDQDWGYFGTVESDGGIESASYYIIVSGACPDKHEIVFTLELSDSSTSSWTLDFTIVVNGSSNYLLQNISFIELIGDGDEFIDVGEVWCPEVTIGNVGDATGKGVYVRFLLTDLYMEFYNSYYSTYEDVYFGTIGVGKNVTDTDSWDWAFEILDETPEGYAMELNFQVTDSSDQGPWNLTHTITIVGRASYQLVSVEFFEITSNGDNELDTGEKWNVNITIMNNGEANGNDVQALLTSSDPYVDFYETDPYYRFEDYGTIDVGESKSGNNYYWQFSVVDKTPVHHQLELTVAIWDETGDIFWNFTTSKEVMGTTDYQLVSVEFLEYWGDGDDEIEPTESWYVNITIQNTGKGIGHGVTVTLTSNNPQIEFYYDDISDREVYFEDIPAGEIDSQYDFYSWQLDVAENIWGKKDIEFIIIIRDNSLQPNWEFTIIQQVNGGGLFNHLGVLVLVIGGVIALIIAIGYIVKNNQKVKGVISDRKKRIKQRRSDLQKKREQRQEERMRIKLQKQKEREAKKQQKERQRITRINRNERILLEKFKEILLMSQTVDIVDVAKSLGLNKEQLFEKLIQWQRTLPFQVDDDNIVVVDKSSFAASVQEQFERIKRRLYTCHYCGFPIERDDKKCPGCDKPVLHCVVCKLPISFGDTVGQCPLCETKGHLADLQEWVKVKGTCPQCLRDLPMEGIVPIEDDSKKK